MYLQTLDKSASLLLSRYNSVFIYVSSVLTTEKCCGILRQSPGAVPHNILHFAHSRWLAAYTKSSSFIVASGSARGALGPGARLAASEEGSEWIDTNRGGTRSWKYGSLLIRFFSGASPFPNFRRCVMASSPTSLRPPPKQTALVKQHTDNCRVHQRPFHPVNHGVAIHPPRHSGRDQPPPDRPPPDPAVKLEHTFPPAEQYSSAVVLPSVTHSTLACGHADHGA